MMNEQNTGSIVPPDPAFLNAIERAVGPRGWSTDREELAAHAREPWGYASGRTPLLLKPASTAEVAALVRLCAEHGVPVVPQGGNTGLSGGGVPDGSGRLVVLGLGRMNAIREVDPVGDTIVVEAGCPLERVQRAAAEAMRLFPLDLGARGSCAIGGNLSTNAGGPNVLRYGMARDLVLGLEVVLADGTVWNGLRALRKDNTGYDLKQLFIGAEGTLGVITAACLRLLPRPRERQTVWFGVPSPEAALELLALCRERLGETITAFEIVSDPGVRAAMALRHAPSPVQTEVPWHIVLEAAWSFETGLAEHMEGVIEAAFERELALDGTLAASETQRTALWDLRDAQTEALDQAGEKLRHDVSIPVAQVPAFLEAAGAELMGRFPGIRIWPFGHLGDGNLHYNMVGPPDMPRETFRAHKAEIQRLVFGLVQRMGGSISAEHGIGRLKREELAERYPVDVALMRRLKQALDPEGLMNPGAVIA